MEFGTQFEALIAGEIFKLYFTHTFFVFLSPNLGSNCSEIKAQSQTAKKQGLNF